MAFSLTYGENNNLKRVCTLFLDSLFQRTKRRYDGAFGVVNFSCYNNNNNNNNNKGSRGMGEVAPLYGVDSALVLTNPGVQ